MSEAPEPAGHERYRDDLAAYALGALDEREALELQGHLRDCEPCRAQLRWLQTAVDLLPRAVEQLEPPERLRRRLAATVRAEARKGSRAGIEAAEPRRLRDWGAMLLRPATAVAAGALIVAGAAAGYLLHEPGQSSSVVTARPLPAAPARLAATLERQDGSAILHVAPARPAPPRRLRGVGAARRHASALEPVRAPARPDRRCRRSGAARRRRRRAGDPRSRAAAASSRPQRRCCRPTSTRPEFA